MRFLSDHFIGISRMFVHQIKIFLNFLFVCESVCWLTSFQKGPSLGSLKDQSGLQDKPSGPVGYHYSPPATSPNIGSAFALWEDAELYILVLSLTNLLTFSLFSPLLHQKVGKICQFGCQNYEIWYLASLDTIIQIKEEPNFLYVCQTDSWPSSLLKLYKYRDISNS